MGHFNKCFSFDSPSGLVNCGHFLLVFIFVLPIGLVTVVVSGVIYFSLAFLLVLPELLFCFYVWGRWVFCRKKVLRRTSEEEEEAKWLLEPGTNTALLRNQLLALYDSSDAIKTGFSQVRIN